MLSPAVFITKNHAMPPPQQQRRSSATTPPMISIMLELLPCCGAGCCIMARRLAHARRGGKRVIGSVPMTSSLKGLPSGLVSADLEQGSARLSVDAAVYSLDALRAAAYVFLDRCYVFLTKPAETRFEVTLSPKDGKVDETSLAMWVGELANELLATSWRMKIAEENRAVVETITSQAFAGALGPPSLDDLAQFDFGDEAPMEDPLGIAQSWEEKYGKKKEKEQK